MGSNLYATPPPKGSLEAQRVASCLLIERSHRRAGQSDIGPLTREYCFRATAGKKGRKKRQKKKKEQPTPEIRTRWSIPCPVPCASMHILILIPRPKFRNLGSVARFSTLSFSNEASGAPICGEEDRRSPENMCTFPENVSTEQMSLSRRNNGDQSKEDGRESDIEIASWA